MKKLEMNDEIRPAAYEVISELKRYDNAANVYRNAEKIEKEAEEKSASSYYFDNFAEMKNAKNENSEVYKKWKEALSELSKAGQNRKKADFILTCEKCNVESKAHALNVAMLKAIISTYPKKVPGSTTCDAISEEMTKLLNNAGFNVKMRIYRYHRYGTDELNIYCGPAKYGQSYGHTTIDNDETENTFSAYTKSLSNNGSNEYYKNPEENYSEAVKAAKAYNDLMKSCNVAYNAYRKYAPNKYAGKKYDGFIDF